MTDIMTDHTRIQTLVEKARLGDRAAFDELVLAHEARLQAAITKQVKGSPGCIEVDEAVQETFVQALQSLQRFEWRGDGSFYSWLCGISRNVILKLANRAGRSSLLQVPDAVPADAASPSKTLRRDERFDRLDEALASLPPDYREVLRLSRLERLTVKEIAQRMSRSEYAVKHLIARAIRELRMSFGDTESFHLPDRRFGDEGGGHVN